MNGKFRARWSANLVAAVFLAAAVCSGPSAAPGRAQTAAAKAQDYAAAKKHAHAVAKD